MAAPRQLGRPWLERRKLIDDLWPALAAPVVGVELLNPGFEGSAMVDPFTPCVLRQSCGPVRALSGVAQLARIGSTRAVDESGSTVYTTRC
ncbi:hypothetical protein GCM10023320_11770 [Pseudonocardia adelaidensis]|uniref:Uncharacterized protein n=1 Tax=Pseudonocardia adelaidensis TaxID=648754 RepID=A0ABP9NCC3_9PSEU